VRVLNAATITVPDRVDTDELDVFGFDREVAAFLLELAIDVVDVRVEPS
jgi:hypothetical protein